MSRNTRISAALVGVFLAVIAVIAVAAGGEGDEQSASPTAATPPTATAPADEARTNAPQVVADDPRRLGQPGTSGVTFTEFLDFECEACAAAYPSIEELRRQYAGRVTFNIRYFPIESHQNARNAALAVEAAAQQGKLEEMYQRMYETQASWGEQQSSKAALFRDFAKDLKLNMREYDAAVADPETAARVERDAQAGQQLGVQGTPSFFINEEKIEPLSFDDLREQLDAAIAAQ
ncbi:MAG: thioredoxin domain-containing protein [Solirubrobacteraceae bacterium]|nr:thioredoxin domain-containing protein [Solirubrobacteraceae bacterium]